MTFMTGVGLISTAVRIWDMLGDDLEAWLAESGR
jgi:hypothetical protein